MVVKTAQAVGEVSAAEAFVQEFDLREVDAEPPSFWTRKWWSRAHRMMALVHEAASPGARVLDVGCAQGNLTILLSEAGYRCVGLDLRPEFLTYAAKKEEEPRVSWVVGNGQEMPFAEGVFDVVILGEILEHVAEPDALMVHALRYVRPGGTLICTTPNGRCFRNSDLPPYHVAAQDLDDLRARQFGPAGADHLFALRPEELIQLTPVGSNPRLEYASSALWNRALGVVAPSRVLSAAIEGFSGMRLWSSRLCDGLIVVLTRPDE